MIRLIAFISVIYLAGLASLTANAQILSEQRIAAVVNDRAISTNDLRMRVRFAIFSSNLPRDEATARRLAPRVLDALIDEQLQLQEAEKEGMSLSDEDMKRAHSDAEQRLGLRPGKFLEHAKSLGLSERAANEQLAASILWSRLVQRRYLRGAAVGEDEVTEVIDKLKANKGKRQVRLFEIVLQVPNPNVDQQVRDNAVGIINELQKGASFASLARQFSFVPSASSGGLVGWVFPENLGPDLQPVVEALGESELEGPVRTHLGYHILFVQAERRIMEANPLAAKLDLKQAFLPIPPGASPDVQDQQLALANDLSQNASSCEDLAARARAAGSPVSPDLGVFALGEMAPNMREAVKSLQAGQVSAPVKLPNGLMVLGVCSRDEAQPELPSRKTVRSQLENQRFQVIAQRYLGNLRRDAFIEKRL